MVLVDILLNKAESAPSSPALRDKNKLLTYAELAEAVTRIAGHLRACGLKRNDRVAIFLDSRIETVLACFAVSAAGGIFVLCNPILKGHQVAHILKDTKARFFITGTGRFEAIHADVPASTCQTFIFTDDEPLYADTGACRVFRWSSFGEGHAYQSADFARLVDSDIATIFYTSGSTGLPKGVIISHHNLVAGAASVSRYLKNTATDRILALLPLGFDAGFSQLTTGFYSGAEVILHNYLSPSDVARVCDRHAVTGITAVPPTFIQLLKADWTDRARHALRYFANTGGHMPEQLLSRLRALFPSADPYLMYGLTEAFRSTFLDPEEVDRRPGSIGKAIPNAEIIVVKPDGSLAGPGEEGELVHRGPLVAQGYWNDKELTDKKFRPSPAQPDGRPYADRAVWSGDMVRLDAEGYLYFIGRNDDMIKVGGARVSPGEVEEVLYGLATIREAAVFGVPDEELGARIIAVVAFDDKESGEDKGVEMALSHCRRTLPVFMVPSRIIVLNALPRSPNGKIDRKALKATLASEKGEG